MSEMARATRQGALTLTSVNEDFEMKVGPLNISPVDGLGKVTAKSLFVDDWRFYAQKQFDLEKDSEGHWWVAPNEEAANATLYNWRSVTERTRITTGGILAVGSKNSAKNVVKGVMEVEIEGEERIDVPRKPPVASVPEPEKASEVPLEEPLVEASSTTEKPFADEVAPATPAESAELPEEAPGGAELAPETAAPIVPEVKGEAGENDVGELL